MPSPSAIAGVSAVAGNAQAAVSWTADPAALRTQRIAWSQDMTQNSAGGTTTSNWILSGVAVTGAAAVAPDGSLTANQLTITVGASDIYQNRPCSGSTQYTFSVWLWTSSGTYTISLARNNALTWTGGVFTAITVTTTPTRYSLTWTTAGGDAQNEVLIGANQVSGSTVTTVAAGTIFAWGAQLETSATPTAYMRSNQNGDLAFPASTRVFVKAYPGGALQVAGSVGASSLTFTGLTNGTEYTFTATACNSDGITESDPCTPVLPLGAAVAPTAPQNVSAIAGPSAAAVSWDPPASPTTTTPSAVTGYTITTTPSTSTTSVGAAVAGVLITGLTNGTSYTVNVTATNVVGTSSAATTTVTPVGVPGAPTSVGATAGNTNAVVTWTAPASTGGSAITGYTVTAYPGGATQSGASGLTFTGLTNGTTYSFAVKATNAQGSGVNSSPSSSVTPSAPPTAPDSPAGVGAAPENASAIAFWAAPASDGGSALTGYLVDASPAAPGYPSTVSPTDFSANFSGLTNGVEYVISVSASNAVGDSSPATTTVTPFLPVAPVPPSGVSAPQVPATAGPLSFGQDFNFLGGLQPSFQLVSGYFNLGQALAHRLQTPRGGLFYDLDYGTDIRGYLNSPMTQATFSKIAGDVQAECLKDERVQICTASPAFDNGSSVLSLPINIVSSDGPFSFIFEVTSATVALLSAQSNG